MNSPINLQVAIENVKSPDDLKSDTNEEEIYDNNSEEKLNKKQIKKARADYEEDLDKRVIEAKKSVVDFLEGLLKSRVVKWWLKIFMFFVLGCFMWVVSVTIYDLMYHEPPKPFFIKLWVHSMDYIKTFFAAVGFVVIVFKMFLNGKP